MAGIYGILLNNNKQSKIYKKFYNTSFQNTLQEEIIWEGFVFGRSVLNKFENDRFLYEDEHYIVCFEGINYSPIKSPSDFISAYLERGENFISELKGTFSGFLFLKNEEKIIVFNDPLSTKNIYFFFDKKAGFVFASEMHVLTKLLRINKISISIDIQAVYSLALYGQMFDEYTLANEVKRLKYGSHLTFDVEKNEIIKKSYYHFQKKETSQNFNDIIHITDKLMIDSIKNKWKKDHDNNYNHHLALISGGMDSRVNTLIAKKIGFDNINGYTYGDPSSSDIKIAGKIAEDNFKSHLQLNLTNGDFFIEDILENYVKASDGLTTFTANGIIFYAMSRIETNTYGLMHSGQIGDLVFGSYVQPNINLKKDQSKIGISGFIENKKLISKLPIVKSLIERYDNQNFELFGYEQRIINGTFFGDRMFSNFIDQESPFYNLELINYSLTIPDTLKLNEKIYFDWLKLKHPYVLNYKWEKIGLKPNTNIKINYGRLLKKYYNGAKKHFKLHYDNMNPIEIWFKKNPNLLIEFDKIFNDNIDLIEDRELKNDLYEIYNGYIFAHRNKFAVLTALLAVKLHFQEET